MTTLQEAEAVRESIKALFMTVSDDDTLTNRDAKELVAVMREVGDYAVAIRKLVDT